MPNTLFSGVFSGEELDDFSHKLMTALTDFFKKTELSAVQTINTNIRIHICVTKSSYTTH